MSRESPPRTAAGESLNEDLQRYSQEPNYAPGEDDFEALSRDRVPVRSLQREDLDQIVRIDRRIVGHERRDYHERKLAEALDESGIRISLVADIDGLVVGFIMARVDYGAFGLAATTAVVDTIGVDPGAAHTGVGQALMSQLLANLASLRVETVRTEVDWQRFDLARFLASCGFAPAQRLSLTRSIE